MLKNYICLFNVLRKCTHNRSKYSTGILFLITRKLTDMTVIKV